MPPSRWFDYVVSRRSTISYSRGFAAVLKESCGGRFVRFLWVLFCQTGSTNSYSQALALSWRFRAEAVLTVCLAFFCHIPGRHYEYVLAGLAPVCWFCHEFVFWQVLTVRFRTRDVCCYFEEFTRRRFVRLIWVLFCRTVRFRTLKSYSCLPFFLCVRTSSYPKEQLLTTTIVIYAFAFQREFSF